MKEISAIAVGASAGGVEALGAVLPALRREARVAVFVVVHLPRERPSRLAEIFATKCSLTVVEADDKEPIAPGTIYFAPPDYHLLIDTGPQVSLSSDELVHYSRPSIDVLFESAADIYRDRLLGIVLTGANDDGASGLAAIARGGGATWVQAPHTASASAMPLAALKSTPSSASLELGEMAQRLRGLVGGVFSPAPGGHP
ncbi:MAG: chemotaxis protein CheB [Myxococcales bacterium]|nr:MAG: chemotaxis protein CheB [Myxococcales bacterium]